jgi:hypothetical protein
MTKTLVFLSSLACAIAVSARASADEPRAKSSAVPSPARAVSAFKLRALPDPIHAQSLFYMRLGESANIGPGMSSGPAFGFGYRMELDRIGVDTAASFATTNVTRKENLGYEGSWLKLTAQYYFEPTADRTFYLGGGLSWGARSSIICNQRLSGSGLQAEIIGGYELLRSSTIRLFIQADVTLPFYIVSADAAPPAPRVPTINVSKPPPAAEGPNRLFLPSMGISIGIAWGTPSCSRPQG